MAIRRRSYRKRCCLALTVTAVLAGAACDDAGEVRSYTVPKETVAAPAAAPAPGLPTGPMSWDLPAGWTTLENPNSMRFATLGAGTGAEQIETSITMLGGQAGGIEANINRWRGQVGLPQATAEEMTRDVHTVRTAQVEGVWVDLIGPAPDGADGDAARMFAAIFPTRSAIWFIKTMGSRSAMEPHRDGFVALCESVRFGGSAPTEPAAPPPRRTAPAEASNTIPTWSALPAGWTLDDPPQSMSVASITIAGTAGGNASLTITPLGGSQDLLANINRWRRQVGLGPIDDLDAGSPVEIDIAGSPGHLVDIGGPERRTLGAVSVRGDTTWFYKLTGPDDLVARSRDAFEAFVLSITFEGTDR